MKLVGEDIKYVNIRQLDVMCDPYKWKDKIMVKPFTIASSLCPGLYDTLIHLSSIFFFPNIFVVSKLFIVFCN